MNNQPLITVAICTFNRANYLADTLACLSGQTADPNLFEVIVIDNNSTDNTGEVCNRFCRDVRNQSFRCFKESNQGLSHARNRAVREALADSILFIDDDVILENDFVSEALNCLQSYPEASCAGGRIFVSFDDGDPGWIPGELMPMFGLHDLGGEVKKYSSRNFPRGGNMLIKKMVFEACGMFDVDLGRKGKTLLGSEEKAFFERARSAGFNLYYWPDMILKHRIGSSRLDQTYLKNQSVGIGRSERLRVQVSVSKTILKLIGEAVKLTGSLLLAIRYVLRGKLSAAKLLLKFRIWVLSGFLKPVGNAA
jgi:glucosyl-dolichyl phosphate glucuronosyltransferase